jgi:hypothetical protein
MTLDIPTIMTIFNLREREGQSRGKDRRRPIFQIQK